MSGTLQQLPSADILAACACGACCAACKVVVSPHAPTLPDSPNLAPPPLGLQIVMNEEEILVRFIKAVKADRSKKQGPVGQQPPPPARR